MVAVLAEKVVHLEQQDRHLGVESVADLASSVLHPEELQQFTENHPPPPAATTVTLVIHHFLQIVQEFAVLDEEMETLGTEMLAAGSDEEEAPRAARNLA